MSKILVPIGYPTGAQYPAYGEGELKYSITVGKNRMSEPSEEFYRAWSLVFADPEAHKELRFTRDHLLSLAKKAGIDEAAEMYDLLEQHGMLASFEVDKDSSIDFLKKYRMTPQGVGLGNTREDPTMCRIQIGDKIAISLMFELYYLWQGADSWPSMWEVFLSYSEGREKTGAPLTNDQLSYLYAASVPGMVASGVAFLTWSG